MERYTFNSEELDEYFDRIALPADQRKHSVSSLDNGTQLAYLATLLKHQIVRIPFENLTQHYSWHRVIDVHPLHLHRKIVQSKARGGYCLEANTLFHTVLRSLGFFCYQVAGRVWVPPEERWTGWSHVVNIVVVGNVRYLCDVGFGPREPTQPIPLANEAICKQVWPAQSRLVYETLPQTMSDQKLWIYQYMEKPDADWVSAYCFSETELLPDDLEGLNYAPWIGRSSHFTQKVMCVRFALVKESSLNGLPDSDTIAASDVCGAMTLNQDNFKVRFGSQHVVDDFLSSETQRLAVLRRWFGIELDEEDRRAIIGTVSALRSE